MNPLKVVVIGCVQFSAAILQEFIQHTMVSVSGVVTRARSDMNADFLDLGPLATQHGIPVFYAQGNQQDALASWMRERDADICFCVGWSYLLKSEVLSVPKRGVIGYHPALLPRNRGRHPIIWALVLGLQETGSTFFMMEEGADAGPIYSQVRVPILEEDDAGAVYARLTAVARQQVAELATALCRGTAVGTPQDQSLASHWRKRTPADGRIDWRMPAQGIHNLVRALSRPYPGAHVECRGEAVKVWRTRIGDQGLPDVEPGCIVAVNGEEIEVQCGVGSIVLVQHECARLDGIAMRPGEYL